MEILLATSAIGLAAWYLTPGLTAADNKEISDRNRDELREANHSGFLMSTNTSNANTIRSEETRVVRAPKLLPGDVKGNAMKSWLYYKTKNDIIAELGNGVNVHINRGTLMPNNRNKPGILILPNREAYEGRFGDIPNATYEIDRGDPADVTALKYARDQYGTSGGAPIDGRPYVIPNELYYGNAWGAGGVLFKAVGNEHRDPQYPDHKPSGILKQGPSTSMQVYKKRVRFNN